MTDLDLSRFRALSFDCYGTLIDWESGLLTAFRAVTDVCDVQFSDDVLLEAFASAEAAAEAHEPGAGFRKYRDVLRTALLHVGETLGFSATEAQRDAFAASVSQWPPFADTCAALSRLAARHDLIVLSNVDEDLFRGSERLLGAPFRHVFTAEKIGSYKPDPRNFAYLKDHAGVPADALLHVAQSLFHDIGPARAAGLSTVWVNRRKGKAGGGATLPSSAKPDLEVPDLKTLADLMEG